MAIYSDDLVLEKNTSIKDKVFNDKEKQYHVIFHNDDYTDAGFVVIALMFVFGKSEEEAIELMRSIDSSDKGIVGTYSLKMAMQKIDMVEALKEKYNQPLVVDWEEAM
jgi:ATP-dependent Clp protease adaptor protein ClpS